MALRGTERTWATIIVAFAVLTRAIYLIRYAATDPFYDYLIHDARQYNDWATTLAAGTGWESGPFYQAPLYPCLLALVYTLFGAIPLAAYVLQALSGVVLVLLVLRIGRRTFGTTAGLWAAGLTALYGVLPFYETKLLPGSLAALLAALAIDRLQIAHQQDSTTSWLMAGAVVGLGALVQPGSLLLAPGIAIWLLTDGSKPLAGRFRRGAQIAAAVILVLAPVALHNRWVGGDSVLISSNGGVTFYQGNNEAAQGVFSAPPGFNGAIRDQRRESRQLAQAATGREMSDSEVSRYWFGEGRRFVTGHPTRWLNLVSLKAGLALDNYDHALEYNPQLDPNPIRWMLPVSFAWIFALGAVRWVLGPRFTRLEAPLLISLAAQAAVLLLFYVSGRYRLPAAPALLVMSGAGAAALARSLRSEPRRLLPALACAGLALIVSYGHRPIRLPGLQATVEATGWSDRAEAFAATERPERAVELYRRAAALDPTYPFARLDLSKVLKRMGRQEEALAAATEATRLAPLLSEPHFDLGVLLFESGQLDRAAAEFAEAFRLDPTSAPAGNNLLGTWLRLGQTDQAVRTWHALDRAGLPVDAPLDAWLRDRGLVP